MIQMFGKSGTADVDGKPGDADRVGGADANALGVPAPEGDAAPDADGEPVDEPDGAAQAATSIATRTSLIATGSGALPDPRPTMSPLSRSALATAPEQRPEDAPDHVLAEA
jgi:hypothetical protein